MVHSKLKATKIGYNFPKQLLLAAITTVKVTQLGEFYPKTVAFIFFWKVSPKLVALQPKLVAFTPKVVALIPKIVTFCPKSVAFRLITI